MASYNDEDKERIFEEIFERMSEGEALRNILMDDDMPSTQTFYRWIDEDENKSKQYARASRKRADAIFEGVLDIADNNTADRCSDNAVAVQRDRLRVDARKWIASKLNPKKYGDKVDLTTDGEKIQPQIIRIGDQDVEL